jgi:hypothetical protein
LTAPPYCEGGKITWYRNNPAAPDGREVVGQGDTYTPTPDDSGYPIYYEVECPDPTSPTGYSEPASSPWIGPVRPYYTPDNPLVIPPSNGTLSISFGGVQIQQTGCTSPFTKSTSGISSGGPFNYSVSDVVEIWIGGTAGGLSIGCGASIPTNILWDGSVYYKRSNGAVTNIAFYGGMYGTDGGFGITASVITNGSIDFEFVTSVGGGIGPVYVGDTPPPPVPIVP